MTVKVKDLAFVRFRATDLEVMEAFLTEFGMRRSGRDESTLYMRVSNDEGLLHATHLGDEPGFIGLAFEARTEAELYELSFLDGSSPVDDLDGPGGGCVVRTVDPNAFGVEVGAERRAVGRLPPLQALRRGNDATERTRIGAPVRPASGRPMCSGSGTACSMCTTSGPVRPGTKSASGS